MKRTVRPATPASSQSKSDPLSLLSRIQLAFLDEYSSERPGYDPYDTSRTRSQDVWSNKRKRA